MPRTITCRHCGRQGTRGFRPVTGAPWPDVAICCAAKACQTRLDTMIDRVIDDMTRLNQAFADEYYTDHQEDDNADQG